MNLLKVVIFSVFSIIYAVKPENNGVEQIGLPDASNNTNNGILGLNSLLNKIEGAIQNYEQGFKQHHLNRTINSVSNTIPDEVSRGMLGYNGKHSINDLKKSTNEGNIPEFGNHSDSDIYNKTNQENKTQHIGMNVTLDNSTNTQNIIMS
ncbi:hypothetical protein OIY81_1895 [Cryptosporidium canis]|uniref:Signal peptide-containing protein n=1 Tax=Cryptosporidium canis TaxID=195482 RepID=A0ABQ8P713_9CRYT|nr:hypothetical protein OJ252_1873 [Cryptosporidium canis]KAJ1610894.1 hypothetical protein OIY81_1895 [Cryptosporidium canis]